MNSVNSHMSLEELLRLADGELSVVETVRARHHLAACWDCRAKLRQAENIIGRWIRNCHRSQGRARC